MFLKPPAFSVQRQSRSYRSKNGFTTVAGEHGAADAERDIRGFAVKFYTEEGNWDMVGNNCKIR